MLCKIYLKSMIIFLFCCYNPGSASPHTLILTYYFWRYFGKLIHRFIVSFYNSNRVMAHYNVMASPALSNTNICNHRFNYKCSNSHIKKSKQGKNLIYFHLNYGIKIFFNYNILHSFFILPSQSSMYQFRQVLSNHKRIIASGTISGQCRCSLDMKEAKLN